jgi:hypothetical protein
MNLQELLEDQAAVIMRQERTIKNQQRRIDGLLKRWNDVAKEGLVQWQRNKIQKLDERIRYYEQNYSLRGYGVGQ